MLKLNVFGIIMSAKASEYVLYINGIATSVTF